MLNQGGTDFQVVTWVVPGCAELWVGPCCKNSNLFSSLNKVMGVVVAGWLAVCTPYAPTEGWVGCPDVLDHPRRSGV